MSQQELVNAYLDGQVSRRTLIRRLVASGVSVGAAVSYAQLLAPGRASARGLTGDDHYPLIQLRIRSGDLGNVIQHSRIRVHIATSEELNQLRLAVFLKRRRGLTLIGLSNSIHFGGAGDRTVSIQVNTEPLKHRRRAPVFVYAARGQDDEGFRAFAFGKRTLRK